MSIEAMKQALEALGKLADETPTTHVRAGKAQIEGKEFVALWFDDCSDPIQQATYINATKPSKLKEFLGQVREHLSQAIEQAEKQEPVIGTKTWFEDGKVVTQHLHPSDIYASDISAKRVDETAKDRYDWNEIQCPCGHKMYAKYIRREWVGLTDEEVNQGYADTADEFQFYQVIEAKLREKNA